MVPSLFTLGGQRSIAYDVNKDGTIVGQSEISPGVNHAFVWTNGAGMQDLNGLVLTPGWTLQEARGINDKGQIVGFGINPQGQTHAFLLTPESDAVPPPAPPPCFSDPNAAPVILIPKQTTFSVTKKPALRTPLR
jgi:probable HAF family extracellular repeat protein